MRSRGMLRGILLRIGKGQYGLVGRAVYRGRYASRMRDMCRGNTAIASSILHMG